MDASRDEGMKVREVAVQAVTNNDGKERKRRPGSLWLRLRLVLCSTCLVLSFAMAALWIRSYATRASAVGWAGTQLIGIISWEGRIFLISFAYLPGSELPTSASSTFKFGVGRKRVQAPKAASGPQGASHFWCPTPFPAGVMSRVFGSTVRPNRQRRSIVRPVEGVLGQYCCLAEQLAGKRHSIDVLKLHRSDETIRV